MLGTLLRSPIRPGPMFMGMLDWNVASKLESISQPIG